MVAMTSAPARLLAPHCGDERPEAASPELGHLLDFLKQGWLYNGLSCFVIAAPRPAVSGLRLRPPTADFLSTAVQACPRS